MVSERGGTWNPERSVSNDFERLLGHDPVILISARLPGSGSSTMAHSLADHITKQTNTEPGVLYFGQELRKQLGVTNDDELVARLREIPDPTVYDEPIYTGLPKGAAQIVEGKYATVAGPLHVKDRPVVSIDLTSNPLVSAKRVLQREGVDLIDLLSNTSPDEFLQRLLQITKRAGFEQGQRSRVQEASQEIPTNPNHLQLTFDTSRHLPEEIIGYLNGSCPELGTAPNNVKDWELKALETTQAKLASLGVHQHRQMHPNDLRHFEYQLEAIRYNMDRLSITLDPDGVAKLREDIKHAITDAWYGMMMKKVPRFFVDTETDGIAFDTISQHWSPQYYKLAEAWPILSTALKDKSVLDPFAGAGTMMNLLIARGIPSQALYSDIAYPGGATLQDTSYNYLPTYNVVASQLLFDNLPSWYRPDFSPVLGHVTADAKALPLKDEAVDIVFSDPPYGKNLNDGSLEFMIECLPELMRVSKEGAILMIPMKWLNGLQESQVPFRQLTQDVSHGVSHFPVCYIKIDKEPAQAA